MGTRGAFGVIINEEEKIGYNQMDSYPDGWGVRNLRWLRESLKDTTMEALRELASNAQVVDEDDGPKPTPEEVEYLKPWTNLGVSEQSTDDWYCLTRGSHGDIGEMLACGYIIDRRNFPLDSLFCEWAYIVDFDREVFEVYRGFQEKVPRAGRWAGRPTRAENRRYHREHINWCANRGREPWLPVTPKFKAVELVASWPFSDLPSDEDFLEHFELVQARETLAYAKRREERDMVARELVELRSRSELGKYGKFSAEWRQISNDLLRVMRPSDMARVR